MARAIQDILRQTLRVVLAAFYLAAGVFHLTSPGGFVRITPPFVPFPEAVIAVTGVCEIAGAVGLFIPQTRLWAGRMLALYALCVWPANIYHALWHVHVPPLPDSWWYHGPRLAFQPVLIWAAIYVSRPRGGPRG